MTAPAAPPRALVLDLGGVVFHYRPERRFDGFARATGLDAGTVRKRLMDSGYSRSCDAGRLNAEAAWREGCRLLDTRLGFERFQTLWISAFEPDEAVVALVRRLKLETRVALAMLTNNSALVRQGLEGRFADVLELFRPRLFSAEAGVLKPDPRLFRTLLTLMGNGPDEVLFVDDDAVHVDAAAALGMQAMRFTGATELEVMLRERGVPW
ncbi:MAG: HAD-IA family hydrolase [Gammaproteobacteria bacterium]|nr:HAD-IA family hydrolase [Gammaproteobacteria bacterium]